jgi:hypothetical protein
MIGPNGLQMDPAKVKVIQDWPEPRKVKDIQSFLDFANFYRRYIYDYSDIVVSLTQLTQKNIPWNFDESCKLAFLTLKQAFISAPVLTHYKPGCPLVIETDASDYALAAILSQVEFNGEIHPVTYLSRTFSDTELNYDTHDKELVTTLILNEYRQSSNSSVLVFKLEAQRLLRMPIARYCLSVELVRVRSSLDS